MGLSFVTGAIPFAAADPLRVIPSFVVGSAFTGALVGAFGIKLLAPHGGIFVVFLLSNPLLYLLFILIGAIISGIVYGLLKTCRSTCLKSDSTMVESLFIIFSLSHNFLNTQDFLCF